MLSYMCYICIYSLFIDPSTTAMECYDDDVIKYKHFPRYWPFVLGIHRLPVNSPDKGQWRGALMFSLICVWINGWVNNGEASDLIRHRAHYDVTVMFCVWNVIDNVIYERSPWMCTRFCCALYLVCYIIANNRSRRSVNQPIFPRLLDWPWHNKMIAPVPMDNPKGYWLNDTQP